MPDATPGSTIAPILSDAPQNIEAALSVRFERMPEETLVAGPYTGTATEYPQGDDTSNYQAAPILLPGDLTVGDYDAVFEHAAMARPVRISYRVVGASPSVVTFDAIMAGVRTLLKPRLRAGGFSQGGGGTQLDDFTEDTRPTLATTTEAVARHMGEVSEEFAEAEDDDAPGLVTVAAYRAAIELESSHYPEQVSSDRSAARFWLELLGRYEERLRARIVAIADEGPDGGDPGMDPVWNFGPTSLEGIVAPGSETPIPLVPSRRREW